MFTILIHEEAQEEIRSTALYYESIRAGRGDIFLQELTEAFQQIQRHPLAWAILEDEYHRYLMPHFPYGIIYRLEEEFIYVLAVMNLHRKPGYWFNRI